MTNKASEALRVLLDNARDYDTIEVDIFLHGEPAAEFRAADDSGGDAVASMKERAAADQRDLLDYLHGEAAEDSVPAEGVAVPKVAALDTSWATNSISARLTPDVLRAVLSRDDVASVDLSRTVDIEDLLDAPTATRPARARGRARVVADSALPQPTWSVTRVKAPLLWQLGVTGDGVVAAVIDTGVNYDHPDLADRMWDGGPEFPHHGWDFWFDDDDPKDDRGHGTSCAGIVAGTGSAGARTGVAPGATIMALRVGGTENRYWRAFEFAIEHGVHVISMSMSWKFPSNPNYTGWRRATEAIAAAGILHANSIGNQGDQPGLYPIPYNIATPGNCPPPRIHPSQNPVGGTASAIGCGATDVSDQLAGYSGRGPAEWGKPPYTDYPYANGMRPGLIKPDICAPGPGTTSCNYLYDGSGTGSSLPYSGFGGTSAATPHVAGCLALLAHACLIANKPIVPVRVQEAIENSAARVVGQLRDKENHFGAGRIDVYAAYRYGADKGWW